MTRAFVGIGANLGDPVAQVRAGIAALAALPQAHLVAASSLYRTAPLGYTAQGDFVNAAALLETELAPRALLEHLHAIEAGAGRERRFKDAPRTLDLYLLLYGGETIDEPGLVELDPDCVIPGHGLARERLARIAHDQRIEKL